MSSGLLEYPELRRLLHSVIYRGRKGRHLISDKGALISQAVETGQQYGENPEMSCIGHDETA